MQIRGGIESQEQINWRASMIFCMVNTQFEEEREWKERKEKQFRVKPLYSHHLERKRTLRWMKWCSGITVTTTRASRTCRQKAAERLTCVRHTSTTFLFFFIYTKLKMLLGLNNNNKQTMMKLQPSPWNQG